MARRKLKRREGVLGLLDDGPTLEGRIDWGALSSAAASPQDEVPRGPDPKLESSEDHMGYGYEYGTGRRLPIPGIHLQLTPTHASGPPSPKQEATARSPELIRSVYSDAERPYIPAAMMEGDLVLCTTALKHVLPRHLEAPKLLWELAEAAGLTLEATKEAIKELLFEGMAVRVGGTGSRARIRFRATKACPRASRPPLPARVRAREASTDQGSDVKSLRCERVNE